MAFRPALLCFILYTLAFSMTRAGRSLDGGFTKAEGMEHGEIQLAVHSLQQAAKGAGIMESCNAEKPQLLLSV
jgi:hypothetical protein